MAARLGARDRNASGLPLVEGSSLPGFLVSTVQAPKSLGLDAELHELRKFLKLAAQNKVEAELVKLRYFVGLTLEEAAEVLGISARTADNYWAHARAWLFRELKSQSP